MIIYQRCFHISRRNISTFILESTSGIYELKPSTNSTQINQKLFYRTNEYLNVFIPNKTASTCLDHVNVAQIGNRFTRIYPDTSFGYLKQNNSFTKTVNIATSSPILNESKNLLNQLVFKFNNDDVTLLDYSDDNIRKDLGLNEINFHLVKVQGPHPLFENTEHVAAQKSFDDVIQLLSQLSEDCELRNVVNIILEKASAVDRHQLNENMTLKYPFIVVEGLDGTGKSTMMKNLSKHLNASMIHTPPVCIASYRKGFNKLPELCKRLYYYLGNYIAAQQVINTCQHQPVVMDRYWYSTMAYAIATQSVCGVDEYLPHVNHPIYNWPTDLLKPSAVVYLCLPERTRYDRLDERDHLTHEEKKMKTDMEFKSRIVEVYKRLRHINWIDVDTSGTQEESLQLALKGLRECHVFDYKR